MHGDDRQLLRDGQPRQNLTEQELDGIKHERITEEFAQMLGAGRDIDDEAQISGVREGREFTPERVADPGSLCRKFLGLEGLAIEMVGHGTERQSG